MQTSLRGREDSGPRGTPGCAGGGPGQLRPVRAGPSSVRWTGHQAEVAVIPMGSGEPGAWETGVSSTGSGPRGLARLWVQGSAVEKQVARRWQGLGGECRWGEGLRPPGWAALPGGHVMQTQEAGASRPLAPPAARQARRRRGWGRLCVPTGTVQGLRQSTGQCHSTGASWGNLGLERVRGRGPISMMRRQTSATRDKRAGLGGLGWHTPVHSLPGGHVPSAEGS